MNALLEAAVAWRDADNLQRAAWDAMMAVEDNEHDEWYWWYNEHDRVVDEMVLPAKRVLRLAIEQAENDSNT